MEEHDTMIGKRSSRVLTAAFALLAPLLLMACGEEHPQTTFRPVTEFGALINGLFYNTTLWTIGILVIVEAVLVYILIRFRARPDAPDPQHVHGNAVVEIIWTIIPAIIVAIIAVPVVQAIFELQRPKDPGAFEVEVIGHQWWWEFRYPELEGVVTANEMHVPVGRTIYLTMHSADVIHSFWIPRIGGKRDVNPVPATREGEAPKRTHLQFTVNQAGAYDGQCAEYCGTSHAIMRMRVIAHDSADFDRWVQVYRAPKPAPSDPLAARGQQIFSRASCIGCHAIAGTSTSFGRIGPNLTFLGDRFTIGAGALDNTRENIERWITAPQEVKPGALMPGVHEGAAGFPPTALSEEEITAVAAYLHSLTAEAVRPGATPPTITDTTNVPTIVDTTDVATIGNAVELSTVTARANEQVQSNEIPAAAGQTR